MINNVTVPPITDCQVEEIIKQASISTVHQGRLLDEHDVALMWVSLAWIWNFTPFVEDKREEYNGIKFILIG